MTRNPRITSTLVEHSTFGVHALGFCTTKIKCFAHKNGKVPGLESEIFRQIRRFFVPDTSPGRDGGARQTGCALLHGGIHSYSLTRALEDSSACRCPYNRSITPSAMPEVSSATCDPSQKHFHVARIRGLAFDSAFVTLGPSSRNEFTKLL